MVKVIANNLIDSPELLKNFSYLGYAFLVLNTHPITNWCLLRVKIAEVKYQ